MEEKTPLVDILLATYNGEKFLREQLDSVFNQTYQHFKIIIRDDGSTDSTLEIIKKYQQQFPAKVTILKDSDKNLGATQNFARLMLHATSDYISFCDQDDIWMPAKLSKTLKELCRLEQEHPGKPCLVYSDMKLIDETGKQVHGSVWERLRLHPAYFTFPRLLIQNIPHGCAMLYNKKLLELVTPVPQEAMLHDHWIAIITATLGEHSSIEEPLVLLRNHDKNVTRKQESTQEKIQRVFKNFMSDEAYEQMVQLRVEQAKAIQERYATQLSQQQSHTLEQFIMLGSTRGFERKWIYLKNGFFRTTPVHTLKMVLRG